MTHPISEWLRCKVCGSDDVSVTRDNADRNDTEMITSKCGDCGATESVIG